MLSIWTNPTLGTPSGIGVSRTRGADVTIKAVLEVRARFAPTGRLAQHSTL